MNRVLHKMLELVYPWRCAACEGASQGVLCEACHAEQEGVPSAGRCVVCQGAGVGPWRDMCVACLEERPRYEEVRACWRYGGPTALALRRLKYGGGSWVARGMAEAMVGWVEAQAAELGVGEDEEVRIVPIPAHGGVLAGRGYHPASMLCGELEGAWARRRRAAGYPLGRLVMRDDVLWRTRRSAPQASMGDAGARARNVAGSFGVRGSVSGLVVVFDDVVTTGSTVGEAARALREAGAGRVVVWAAARA